MAIDKSKLTKVSGVYPMQVMPYEQYMALSENPSVVQKINDVIQSLHNIGKLTNQTVSQWNRVMDWVVNEGLEKITTDVTNEKVAVALQKMFDTLDLSLDNGLKELTIETVTAKIDEMLDTEEFDLIVKTAIVEINQTVNETLDEFNLQLAEKVGGTKKAELEDLSPTVLGAIEGGAETTFNLLSIPQEGSVTPTKTTFLKNGKNMVDNDTLMQDFYLHPTSGVLTAGSTYATYDYIAVDPNTSYTRSHRNQMAFYTIDKTFISSVGGASPSDQPETFTAPANCYFVRISVNKSYIPNFQLEIGSIATPWERPKITASKIEIERPQLSPSIVGELEKIGNIEQEAIALSGNFDRIAEFRDLYTEIGSTNSPSGSLSNTSTFSGWGSPVGIRQNFDALSFYVNQWDSTKPITKVRVIVKESNVSGTILADQTFDVNLGEGGVKKLTLRLSTQIENLAGLPLWVEYHTDGKTGYTKAQPSDYLPPEYPKIRYSTTGSVTAVTTTAEATAGTDSIYFEFKSYAGKEILPTLEFSRNISIESKVDHYGKFKLKNWQSQASKYDNPSFNERLEFLLLGDSWVQGKFRLVEPLRNKLKAIYGDGGIGFIGFANNHYGNGAVTVTLEGTWVQVDAHTGASSAKGIDVAHAESATVGSTATVAISEGSTYFRIEHLQQVGSYRYQVDGGAWTTVDTSTSEKVEITGLADVNHTFVIEVLSGKVTLTGGYSYKASKGAVVSKAGNGGMTAEQLLQSDATNYVKQLAKSNAHTVGILLGTNDMSMNAPIDTFRQRIISIIGRVKSALPLSDILLIAPNGNNLTGRLHTMQEYSDVLLDIAKTENRVAFVSLYENVGTYEEANARGLMGDGVHPNASGGYVNTNVVYDRLLRV